MDRQRGVQSATLPVERGWLPAGRIAMRPYEPMLFRHHTVKTCRPGVVTTALPFGSNRLTRLTLSLRLIVTSPSHGDGMRLDVEQHETLGKALVLIGWDLVWDAS
ncbi:MAG TPA: hypothetical protein VMM78_08035 [Thermomicrobiales bacterium]|nr:hypothetical protein [Thermomicrobiales bacterium]